MLVNIFDEHCDSSSNSIKYELLEYMAKDLWNFETLSVLDSSPYEYFNVPVTRFCRSTFAKEDTKRE